MRITPVELKKIEAKTANIYEAVIVAGKKARKINDENKLEFSTQVSAVVSGNEDDFEERENPDQLRISLEFEKKPKPHLQAMQDLLAGKVEFRYKDAN